MTVQEVRTRNYEPKDDENCVRLNYYCIIENYCKSAFLIADLSSILGTVFLTLYSLNTAKYDFLRIVWLQIYKCNFEKYNFPCQNHCEK